MADSRLAFDILARDDGASAVFDKVARAADRTGDSMKKNSKISAAAAKASEALTKARGNETNALDKVQVAEAKLASVRQTAKDRTSQVQAAESRLLQVRNDTSSSTSTIAAAEAKLASARSSSRNSSTQVLAGEKALSKARREAATAGDVAQKAAKDLGSALDNEGKKAGKGAVKSVLRWFTGAGKDFEAAGKESGSLFSSGITGVLKTPVIGPALIAAALAAVTAAAIPAGAILAGGVVLGFGAGIVGLGLKFAAESKAVKAVWSKTASDLGGQMRTISKPFEATLISMSGSARKTFATFRPELEAAFKTLAPVLTAFGDQFGQALGKLAPAIQPLAAAFKGVLGALGPALNDMFTKLSSSLTKLSESVSKNPTALADFTRGVGDLTGDLLSLITHLNDADGAFKRLTGVSAVTGLMNTLRGAVQLVVGPIDLLSQGLTKLANLTAPVGQGFVQTATSAKEAATATGYWLQGMTKAQASSVALGGAVARSAHETHAANVAAYLLATAYDRQWAATQKANSALMQMSGLLLTLSGSEIAYQQAVDDVTAAIKENGKTHDINTQKGRDNQTALDQSAASANAQTVNLRNSNKASVAVAIEAQREYAKQAVQMGYTAAEAHRMSLEFIKIPKKTKADIQVDITDMTSKVATAKKQLADPHLSATKRAKLEANIVQWQAGIVAAKRSLAGLPVDKTAKLKADKANLDAQLAAAKRQLADPHLTATKRAKLEATYANLQAAVRAAQATINSLHGKTVTNSVVTKYSSTGVNLTAPSSVGRRAAGGPVSKGVPYIVGEKRPELFVPNQSGTIIPKVPSAAVGQSIAAGMAGGLRGGAGAAVSAAADVANAVIGKAKDVLGIASPSKAFAQLGLYVNQGFKTGLLGSAKSVQSAMSSLMGKVLNISFNAADTKKSIQKTITSLNTALSAARARIKPIKHGMSSKEVAAAERSNRAVSASIRAIQAKLKTAKVDLANVNSIAARMGTTVKRNAIIGMLQRENAAMQKLANARAVVAVQLKAAQDKLAAAVQVRDEFKKQITDAAMSFNSIANIQPPEGGSLTASGIIAQMSETLRKTQQFAANLARLKKSGLNSTTYQAIAEAGVEQGGSLADALLSGGGNTFNSINRLQSNINSAAAGLGSTAATNLYQAGVDAAQGLVNGLLAKTKALDAASKKLAAAIVAQIKKTLGIRSPSKVLEWHGSMVGQGFSRGIEGEFGRVQKAAAGMGAAATPGVSGRRRGVSTGGGGGDIHITVNGALDPNAVALQIQQILKRYARTGGLVAA